MSEPFAYLRGQFLPVSQALLPVYDAGVVMGATVSELLRTFRGKLFRLDSHLDRLFLSLQLAQISVEETKDRLRVIAEELVERNLRFAGNDQELGLVIFVTAGDVDTFAGMWSRPSGAGPTVCLHTFPPRLGKFARWMERGARLITPTVRQVPRQCWDPNIKCRSRMHYYLAERQARQADPEASALLLDLEGNVAEGSAANFLMAVGDKIVSPPRTNILVGVSRAVTIELAEAMGISVLERSIPLAEVAAADEAFLTSTLYCLAPVSHINRDSVSSDCPGPIYRRLLEAWNNLVGLDIRRQIEDAAQQDSLV
jgi:branched-subunit amino acid aminotransferase/4-amino-4-deoxychorismate lyase